MPFPKQFEWEFARVLVFLNRRKRFQSGIQTTRDLQKLGESLLAAVFFGGIPGTDESGTGNLSQDVFRLIQVRELLRRHGGQMQLWPDGLIESLPQHLPHVQQADAGTDGARHHLLKLVRFVNQEEIAGGQDSLLTVGSADSSRRSNKPSPAW